MSILLLIALLVGAVITANIVQPFFKRIPEALILVAIGVLFSILPIFHGFKINPEFFMFLIIAPIMFQEGQSHSFATIRKNSKNIIQLSVFLAIFTVALVALVSSNFQTKWPLALTIALAAIIVPTDAVAVKSMTSGLKMPKGLNKSLELESLFNDATGIVLLNLALSFFAKGTLNPVAGINYFLFVAIGGLVIGFALSYLMVGLGLYLNFHANSAQATTIPLNLLTPFVIYIIAEHMGTSGILAVVAAGIVHNWERSRLQLISTESQVVTATIWQTLTTLLNGIAFVILGLALPAVFKTMATFGWAGSLILLSLALAIYLAMFLCRFLWVTFQGGQHLTEFFGKKHTKNRQHRARIFGLSGVHGAVTLALAMSLPEKVNGHPLPFLDEIQIVAALVILISLLIASVALPLILPKENQAYSQEKLESTRNKMIDTAILSVEQQAISHDLKKALSQTLQTQKFTNGRRLGQKDFSNDFLPLVATLVDELNDYIDSESTQQRFGDGAVTIYSKIIRRGLTNPATKRHPLMNFARQIRRAQAELRFHTRTRTFTRKQRARYQKQYLAEHPNEAQKIASFRDNRQAVWALNNDVQSFADHLLAKHLAEKMISGEDTADIDRVRVLLDRFFQTVAHDYQKVAVTVPADLYIQAFGAEYRFVSQSLDQKKISSSLADQLYHEINQAQTLQLMDLTTETE
ncbi:Na/H antiporter [Fructobacillus pseudoficulneus]|uniref:Na/H antiporter n=1 Tax=Fructobacillus pseudoficulneus TaxID=220714 RepID=A0A3F3GVX6_9LACO|nr:sodium:proton antiporter [Fructobacillus pseudoficulneus]GAP02457.1 Na/H antiporter [Fructobacillus pseudoficulneus]SEH37017.1 monovalent cation:H+ antiporter, CPA1 family [Fructobacillus pseudoficulneus]